MTTPRHLLCATDLSPASEPAWQMAQRLARILGAEVVLLHVVPPVPIPTEGYFPPSLFQELVEGARREGEAAIAALLEAAGDGGLKARGRVLEGPPAQRIVEAARHESSDLVIVGTHGRTGFGRVLLGSVADRVVRTAHCPVLTVRPRPAGAAAAAGTTSGFGRILYATDFSPTARAAWPWVLALAETGDARVDLLHVTAQPVPDRHLPPDIVARMARLLEEQARSETERFLQEAERIWPGRLRRDRLDVVIGRGVVGDQIVHLAQARGADLIVMGTHGWSGLLRWMLGSVAHHVIQTAPCPVLTVGPEAAAEGRPSRAD